MILVPFLTALLFFTAFAFLGISNPFKKLFKNQCTILHIIRRPALTVSGFCHPPGDRGRHRRRSKKTCLFCPSPRIGGRLVRRVYQRM
jgi:hypothetical protein